MQQPGGAGVPGVDSLARVASPVQMAAAGRLVLAARGARDHLVRANIGNGLTGHALAYLAPLIEFIEAVDHYDEVIGS